MFIIRSIAEVYAHPSGKVFENKKDGKIAFERSEAEEAILQDMIIYSGLDFQECYIHHVEGEPHRNRPDEIYSVLRRVGIQEPIKIEEFRSLFCKGLLTNRITRYKLEIQFPKEFAEYKFRDGTCLNWEKPGTAIICYRDIKNITIKQLPVIAKQFLISDEEQKEIMKYISASFARESGYRIRFLFAIGHSDIRAV